MSRAGRKRKDGRREPSGKAQRVPVAVQEKHMKSVVLEARQRVYGVSAKVAEGMAETSWLGRLVATGALLKGELDAATEYRSIVDDYDRAHPIRGYPRPGDLNKIPGMDGEDVEGDRRRYLKARERFDRCEDALWSTNGLDHHAAAVTRNVVLGGYESPAHVPSLKIGLDALRRALGIPEEGWRAVS